MSIENNNFINEKMDKGEKIYDILVIGGGISGTTAALYGKRAGKSLLLVEPKQLGGLLNTTHSIENFPCITHISDDIATFDFLA